jgi:glycosyltransferase involved in cell wall biosynthesis
MKVLLFANTEWYLYNFRLSLARALRDGGADVVLISPPGPYGKRLQAEGFRWISVEMNRRSLNPLREVMLLKRLLDIYRSEKPDIGHHFTIKCVVYGSFAARIAGIKRRINAVAGMGHVFTSNTVLAKVLRPFVRWLLKIALTGEDARLVLQNTDDCSLFEKQRLIAREHIRLIRGSGVDTARFRPRAESQSHHQPLRVFFAARLLWDKGVREYAMAARLLKQRGYHVDFLLAGAPDFGNPAAVPQSLVDQWKEEGSLIPVGHVDNVLEWLHQVDIAVLPSFYREGVPRSLIEAAACELPIVTTDTPGCRDIVHHNVNGLLVPAKNAVALADAIQFLVDHPDERRRMGIAGRERVIREFDEGLVVRKTVAIYEELLRDEVCFGTPA